MSFTGDHLILVRSTGENGTHSIAAHSEFYAYGKSSAIDDNDMIAMLFIIGTLILVGIAITAYRKKLFSI